MSVCRQDPRIEAGTLSRRVLTLEPWNRGLRDTFGDLETKTNPNKPIEVNPGAIIYLP